MSKSFQNSNCQQAKARRYVVFYKEWGYMSLLGPLKIYVNKKKSAVCRPISKKMKNKFEKKNGEKSARHTGPTSAYVYPGAKNNIKKKRTHGNPTRESLPI